jgi:predicted transcriptional regulator
MTEITLRLGPVRHRALADLADAQGRRPEEVVGEAVEAYLRAEEAVVQRQAERLAGEHAALLRRLGE